MMKLSPTAINFIKSVQDKIDNNDFYEIYSRLNLSDLNITSELTAAFLMCNINPLDHLDFIPADYFKDFYIDDEEFKIPTHITKIGSYAFENTLNMRSCYIPDSCEAIYTAAFRSSEALTDLYIPYSVRTIGSSAIDDDVIIHGVKNSVAEEYARYNGNEFKYDYRY